MKEKENMYIVGMPEDPGTWLIVDPTRITVVVLDVIPQCHPAITKMVLYKGFSDRRHNEHRLLRLYDLRGDKLMVYLDKLGIKYPETAPEDRDADYCLGIMRGDTVSARYYVKALTKGDSAIEAMAYTKPELAQGFLYLTLHLGKNNNDKMNEKEEEELFRKKIEECGIKNSEYLATTLLKKYWYVQASVDIKEEYRLYFFNTEDKKVFLFKMVNGVYTSVPDSQRDTILKDNNELNIIINKAIKDDVIWFNLHYYIDGNGDLGVFTISPEIADQKCQELLSMIKDTPTDAIIHTIKQVNPYYSSDNKKLKGGKK